MPKTVISNVITAAATRDLTTLATIKADFGAAISDASDDFLTRAIMRASAAAENFCNRVFAVETVQDVVFLSRDDWPHIMRGGLSTMQLSRWPIVSVSSVTEDAATAPLTPNSDYVIDHAAGQLLRVDSDGRRKDWSAEKVTVIYQAGYLLPGQNAGDFPGAAPLPFDIEDAIGRMVYTRVVENKRDPFVRSETVDGIGRTDYIVGNSAGSDGGNLSADVTDILNNYRVPVAR